jgi:hypothetical protein
MITYSFLIEPASSSASSVQLLTPEPPASPTNIYRTKASSKQMDVAGLSCKLSMADPDNPFDTDTRRRDTTFPFAMVMQPPRMGGKSFRLTRAFASRRIISFKISKKLKKDKFKVRDMLLGRVLLVLGRTYRAFWATPEGENVFAVETGDQMPSGWRRQLDERNMPSFMDMMAREPSFFIRRTVVIG